MADSLALTFGSDFSGNSNITTISIASGNTYTLSASPYDIYRAYSVYCVNWPTGATQAIVRPTCVGTTIIVSGLGIIDDTMSTTPNTSIAVTGINISSSPTASGGTIYVYNYNQKILCSNSESWYNTGGVIYGAIFIFF